MSKPINPTVLQAVTQPIANMMIREKGDKPKLIIVARSNWDARAFKADNAPWLREWGASNVIVVTAGTLDKLRGLDAQEVHVLTGIEHDRMMDKEQMFYALNRMRDRGARIIYHI